MYISTTVNTNKTKVTTTVINRIRRFSTFLLNTFFDNSKSTSTYLSETTCLNNPNLKSVIGIYHKLSIINSNYKTFTYHYRYLSITIQNFQSVIVIHHQLVFAIVCQCMPHSWVFTTSYRLLSYTIFTYFHIKLILRRTGKYM